MRHPSILHPLFSILAFSPLSLAQTGDTLRVHDPAIAFSDGAYYLYSTGRGLPTRTSKDLFTWTRSAPAFDRLPDWAKQKIPQANSFWAPDLSFFNNQWHLYYAVSSFGSDTSVIGLATSPTLDPASPNYKWTDHGLVVESKPKGGWNAIDPALALDADDHPYLFFGSFWGGLKAVEINPATGKPANDPPTLIDVAARPDTKSHAIEAPFVFRHAGYYYLFASFDLCCQGANSTYNIVVGRSKNILGPYADADGKPMLQGGGTLLLAGYDHFRGPGHNAVLHDDATKSDYLVHHIYDLNKAGQATLQIRPLLWDNQGWPLPGEPLSSPPRLAAPLAGRIPTPEGTWNYYSGNSPTPTVIHLTPDHKISDFENATWSQDGPTLTLTWPSPKTTDTVLLAPDARSYVGRNTAHTLIRGYKTPKD